MDIFGNVSSSADASITEVIARIIAVRISERVADGIDAI